MEDLFFIVDMNLIVGIGIWWPIGLTVYVKRRPFPEGNVWHFMSVLCFIMNCCLVAGTPISYYHYYVWGIGGGLLAGLGTYLFYKPKQRVEA